MVRLWRRSAGRSRSAVRRDRSGQGRPALRATSKDDRNRRWSGTSVGARRRSPPCRTIRRRAPPGARATGAPPPPAARAGRAAAGRRPGSRRGAGRTRSRWPGLRPRLARRTRSRRAVGCTFVASTTVVRPAASRRSRAAWRAPNAVRLTAWSASPCPSRARNASDDRTSPGAKWRAAKVDLPEPAAPTRTTTDGSGIARSILIGR